MKKLFLFIISVAIIIFIIFLVRGKEDTWVKDSNGRWIRHGNPSIPIPANVLGDCYEQNNNRALDFAIISCREDLCGADTACARYLEKEFNLLSNTKLGNNPPLGIPNENSMDQPVDSRNSGVKPSSTEASTTPSSLSTSTPPASSQTTNSNTNTAESQPTPTAPTTPPQQSPSITIDSPTSGSSVTSPLVITGKIKANAGDLITIQITNTAGTVLISETAKLKAVDAKTGFGTYKITISYEFSSTREGFIVISHENDKTSVPVTFE